MIFIDRKNKTKSRESIRLAGQKVKNGKNVISFAEGTRTKTGELMKFRRGSFTMAKAHELDIVPVGILGSRSVLASGSSFIHGGKTIKVKIGEVMRYEDYKEYTTEEHAEICRLKVKALINELKEL